MRTIISFCLLCVCQFALFGQARLESGKDYAFANSTGSQTMQYVLQVEVIPTQGGSTNLSGANKYAEGTKIRCNASPRNGYCFVKWMQGNTVLSTTTSFTYTMPAADVKLTAIFEYNPTNPADPDSLGLMYTLTVEASPSQGGSFNMNKTTDIRENDEVSLYAYPKAGYVFKGWEKNGEIISAGSPYTFKMGNKDIWLTGLFEYSPSNPSNPGSNSWNAVTGEVIVGDFIPGRLSDAIFTAIGGRNNNNKITMIIVSGEMNPNDFGVANNFKNCTLLDLSRTFGYTVVPSYAFDYCNLTSVILPATVEEIGYQAFYKCADLTDITCYAVVPPVVKEYAFDGIAEGAVLHVLSSSISLYAEADGWKDFTILPLMEEIRTLQVNLPKGSEDGRYKNMVLELLNTETGQKQKYVVSDRVVYTFNGLLKGIEYSVYLKSPAGTILGQIDKVEIAEDNVTVTLDSVLALQEVTLKVVTPEGADVTAETQISWFDVGNVYLARGMSLSGQLADTRLGYRIVLDRTLGMQYVLPADQTYTVQDGENLLTYTLQPIDTLTVSGTVKDVNGMALSGATVSVSQKLNGKYSKAFIAQTDNKGAFKLNVYNDRSTLSVSATDYITQTVTRENFDEGADLGVFALKSITGATVAVNFTYTPSVAEGETAEVQNWYSDYANVVYTLYNITRDKAVTEYSVQYPSIVLLEEAGEGDQIRITASSKNHAFVPVEGIATIDAYNKASVTFDIVALGGIKASFTSTDNAAVVGILYDRAGELVKKYDYYGASLTISDLTDGEYTLVSMANSALFNSILKLNQIAPSGLKEGADYVQNSVTVKSGVITTVANEMIPVLDESKLYYTGDQTLFSVNKSSVVVGNYLTLKGKIDFKSDYVASVSDVKMVIDLPEASSFVENSVMVGSKVSNYILNGTRLTIPLERYSDQVRFCIIPTAGGSYSPNAFAEFTLGGKTIQQPIGSANYTVKDLTISVPSTVAKTTLPISGTALGNSSVDIYDDGVLIGQTTSLANGVWSATCELNQPYNLSTHPVYAKVTTKQGMVLQSETQEIMYDIKAVEASTVTMIYNGLNFVFDLLKGTISRSSYNFSTATDMTFIINFTNNSPAMVSNVILYVFTDHNEVKPLKATYDEKKDRWIAVNKFSMYNLPVNVSVGFSIESEPLIDREKINAQYSVTKSFNNDEFQFVCDSLFFKLDHSIDEKSDSVSEITHKIYEMLNIELVESTSKDPLAIDSLINEIDIYLNSIKDECNWDFITDSISFKNENDKQFNIILGKIEGSGIDEEKLLLEYESYQLTDSTRVFFSSNQDYCYYVDTKERVYIKIENRLVKKNSTLTLPRSIGLDELNSLITIIDINESVLEGLGYDVEKLKMSALSKIDKRLASSMKKLETIADQVRIIEEKWPGKFKPIDYYKLMKSERDILKQIAKYKTTLKYLGRFFNLLNIGFIVEDARQAWESCKEWKELIQDIEKIDCPGMEELAKEANDYAIWVARGYKTAILANVANLFSLKAALSNRLAAIATLVITDFTIIQGGWNQINDIRWKGKVRSRIPTLKCQELIPLEPKRPTTPNITPFIDPSGYVYEAIQNNRLPGVTATCFYKETVEDMYGDLHENVVLWDAAEYAQENPLFTDENGMYAWDVPQGLWQVKFEKEGYQTTYSEWLPVPPPQLEVNIAMTQNLQPTVKTARAYEYGIEVEFDKYMLPETLAGKNIFITKNGENITGTVALLNEEKVGEDNASTYASKVRFIPEVPFLTTDEVTLTVSRKVKSYAGIPMESDYTQNFDIVKEIKKIAVDSLIQVLYNGEKEIIVSALPYDAAIGKKLTARSSSPLISTVTEEAVLDEKGQAKLIVTGELPGASMIEFSIEDANVTSSSIINVVTELSTVAAPTASRASGTAVYRNASVTLSTETKDAVIYYTVDGTCPCDENGSRQLYTEPILIVEDVILKAVAISETLGESEISTFEYTIKKTALGMDMKTGWNWVSHNLETAVSPVVIADAGVERFVGQSAELVRDPKFGLIGNLDKAELSASYKVQMRLDSVYTLKGYECNAAETLVALNAGWNWIGYPVNQVMTVNEAMTESGAEELDYIVGQDGFAQFVDGTWKGTLETMVPGKGYMYYSGSEKSFTYYTSLVSKAQYLYGKGQQNVSPWAVDKYKYPKVMCLVADIYKDGKIPDTNAYSIGAFCGTECRGIGRYVDNKLMMNIYGTGNEKISFKAVDNNDEQVYEVEENAIFSETMLGNLYMPYSLHIGKVADSVDGIEIDWQVSPMPVVEKMFITGDISTIQRLTLTDTYGKVVLICQNIDGRSGIDVSNLPDGIYILTLVVDNETFYKKIMKASK